MTEFDCLSEGLPIGRRSGAGARLRGWADVRPIAGGAVDQQPEPAAVASPGRRGGHLTDGASDGLSAERASCRAPPPHEHPEILEKL